MAWLKSFPEVAQALPEGWVECNGQVLDDPTSSLNGQTIPDLNGSASAKRFLRGSTSSGSTGGSDVNNHTHSIAASIYMLAGAGQVNGVQPQTTSGPSDNNNMPSFYEVVWIMRVK